MLTVTSAKTLDVPVPGREVSARVTVITGLRSPYGAIQDYISDVILETGRFFEEDEVAAVCAELSPGDLFLDIGANIGTFTAAARACGAETVSIEPQPILQKTLRKNAGKGEVHAVGCGTFKEDLEIHEAFMRHPRRGTIMANLGGNDLLGLMGRKPTGQKVPIRTLDSVIGDRDPKVVKVDVEGMEADVLDSGRAMLERCHPVLYLEQNSGNDLARSWRILRPMGYGITDIIGGLDASTVVRYAVS